MLCSFHSVLHQGIQVCSAWLPDSPHRELYAALVCGVDLGPSREKQLFLDSGLIHILVVSGAHLHFVERLVFWLPEKFRIILCAAYCWLTGFGAPVVRALVRRFCVHGLKPWAWSSLQIEAMASVLLLLAKPEWIYSRSFLMSWLCALALQSPLPISRYTALNLSVKCYVFLFPFCPSSPIGVLWNALFAPIIGEILFPLCLVAMLIPNFAPISDKVWDLFLYILSIGPQAEPLAVFVATSMIWWLPILIHSALLFGEWKWRRTLAFS